jgi:YceI-like domain
MRTTETNHGSKEALGGRWRLDPRRSSVEFRARHFWGLGTVEGHFDGYEGRLELSADPAIELTIDASSVQSGNPKRDRHLRSADFFDAGNHARVRFRLRLGRPAGRHAESAWAPARPRPVDHARARRAGPPSQRRARYRGRHHCSAPRIGDDLEPARDDPASQRAARQRLPDLRCGRSRLTQPASHPYSGNGDAPPPCRAGGARRRPRGGTPSARVPSRGSCVRVEARGKWPSDG